MTKTLGNTFKFEKGSNECNSLAFANIIVQRTIWSFAIEAVLEYCRVNFDIFGQSKPVSCRVLFSIHIQISLISVDVEERILSLWYESDQSLKSVWNAFTSINPSNSEVDLSYPGMPGLFSCKNTLHMPTPEQVTQNEPKNLGRVIVLGTDIESKLKDWIIHLEKAMQTPPTESRYGV